MGYERRYDAGGLRNPCYAKGLWQPHRNVTPVILPNAPRFGVCCTCVEYPTRNIAERLALTKGAACLARRYRGPEPLEGAKMARQANLPVLNGESGLSRYLAQIPQFPMLE